MFFVTIAGLRRGAVHLSEDRPELKPCVLSLAVFLARCEEGPRLGIRTGRRGEKEIVLAALELSSESEMHTRPGVELEEVPVEGLGRLFEGPPATLPIRDPELEGESNLAGAADEPCSRCVRACRRPRETTEKLKAEKHAMGAEMLTKAASWTP